MLWFKCKVPPKGSYIEGLILNTSVMIIDELIAVCAARRWDPVGEVGY